MGTSSSTTSNLPELRTLIPDIYQFVEKTDASKPWPENALSSLSSDISGRLVTHFQPKEPRLGLRLSKMGPQCPRALWYSANKPELAEALPPWATIKYAYGHILEALVVALAKAAGHEVTGEQDELIVDGITGHRDCVIDGCLVDVKSASSRSYQKFKDGSIATSDDFGYLDQLDGYLLGSLHDDLVRTKDRAYLLAIDKQLGHMCLYEHKSRPGHITERIRRYKDIVKQASPPDCECGTEPDGESGNIKLDIRAGYSAYKHCCWPKLRTFLYSNGPRYLTKVVKRPRNKDGDIMEIDKHGKPVYN